MSDVMLFWKAGPRVALSPPEIARELLWGEEVPGLVDLPVKEIIDRLKVAFPDHEERAGLLIGRAGTGSFEATWTWQHLKVESSDLPQGDRDRLVEVLDEFGCAPYQHAAL